MTEQRSGRVTIAVLAVLLSSQVAVATTIVIEGRTLRPGDSAFDVRLQTGRVVISTTNVLRFAPAADMALQSNGKPHCIVNSDIDKYASNFTFRPLGCVPGSGCDLRAVVQSYESVDPIPDGSRLYTCTVDPSTPGGTYALHCTEPSGRDAVGDPVPVDCPDAQFVFETGAWLRGGYAFGDPGEVVPLAFGYYANVPVVSVQGELALDAAASVRAAEAGGPDCRVTRSGLSGTFAYLPIGCAAATDCTGVRATVLPLEVSSPIPSGAALFTCEVVIAADATRGEHPVAVSAQGATADGALVPVNAVGGIVRVEGEALTPTPTATATTGASATPTPTDAPTTTATVARATATPTDAPTPTATQVATATATVRTSSGGDGCAIAASPGDGSAVLLVGGVALLLRRRRTSARGR